MAMAIDGIRTGTTGTPTGCRIRNLTNDVFGGTTLTQVVAVARQLGYHFEQYTGANAIKADRVISELREGRRLVVQGNTSATLHTAHRSTNGSINHAVEADEGRGWHRNAAGLLVPTDVLVFDPAADKRRAGIADSPEWWSYNLLVNFAQQLRPWGEDDARTLGGQHMYVAVSPPPGIHLAYGGVRSVPEPDMTRVDVAGGRAANVRKRPDRLQAADIVDRLPDGRLFAVYQWTHGAKPKGATNDRWGGNWNGTRWIHWNNLTGVGGSR